MARESERVGAQFERLLEFTHQHYRDEGRALLEKLHVPAKPFFQQGRFQWRPTGKALPDYGGWLSGGRGILMEAKTTGLKNKWRFPPDRVHQYTYLVEATAYGVLCVYLIQWRVADEVRLYPIASLAGPGHSIEREAGLLVKVENGIVDWLSVLKGETIGSK